MREGYPALSMRRIAKHIGYSATAIYLHFENKDALLHALIDEGMERLYDHLQQTAHAHESGDPVGRARRLCQVYIDFGLQNPEYYDVMFLLRPEHMARYPADNYRRARRSLDLFVEVLQDGAAAGVLEAEAPRVQASAVWAALHGTVTLLLAQRVDIRIEAQALVEAAIDQIVRGLGAVAQGSPNGRLPSHT